MAGAADACGAVLSDLRVTRRAAHYASLARGTVDPLLLAAGARATAGTGVGKLRYGQRERGGKESNSG